MLSLKSAVLGSFLAGLFGLTAAVVGCSAEGDTTDDYVPTKDQQPTDPTAGSSVKLPPKSGGTNASSASSGGSGDSPAPLSDAGSKSSSSSGSTSSSSGSSSSSSSSSSSGGSAGDGGTPVPAPGVGTTCSVVDQKFKKICGKCGAQESICVSTPDGTSGTVSDYGPCSGESTSSTACVAGATEACGNCGTRTCGSTCSWGTCQNQGVCKIGSIQHDNAGCPVPGTTRSQTCLATCGWSSLSASSCEQPLVIVPAVGDTSSTIWELKAGQLGKRPKSCKRTADLTPVTVFPVALKNPTSTDAIVSIWNSTAVPGTTTTLDTTIFTYLRDTAPTTDDDYKACYTESVDGCSALAGICAADGGSDWAGVDNVKVPANSTIIVVTAGFYDSVKGKFVLNVKTKPN